MDRNAKSILNHFCKTEFRKAISDAERRSQRLKQLEDEEAEKKEVEKRSLGPALPPRQWIENAYFSGELAKKMYPKIKEMFCEIYENNIFEILLRGSIGWGKTYLARAIMTYSLYLMSRHPVPHDAFDIPLDATTPIAYKSFNVNKVKARTVYFDAFVSLIKDIPYFRKEFAPQRGTKTLLRFPKMIVADYAGAGKYAAESENMLVALFDEINLYDRVEKSTRSDDSSGSYDEAEVCVNAARYRFDSRFRNVDGTYPLPCKLILLCKETTKKSWMAQRTEEIRKNRLDKDVMLKDGTIRKAQAKIYHFAQWETLPVVEWGKAFWITTPTKNHPSEIIENTLRATKRRKYFEERYANDQEAMPRILKVPDPKEMVILDAKKDQHLFLRDICGIPTDTIRPFISDLESLRICLDRPEYYPWAKVEEVSGLHFPIDKIPEGLKHSPFPIDEDGRGIQATEDKIDCISRYFKPHTISKQKVHKRKGYPDIVSWEPIVFPDRSRFIHIDLGRTNDACGISIGTVSHWVDIERGEISFDADEEVKSKLVKVPFIWYDLNLRIVPPGHGSTRYASIITVFREFADAGFRFCYASADGHQSDQLLETLENDFNCKAERFSLDKTTDGYDVLKEAIFERRISSHRSEYLETELLELEIKRHTSVTLGRESVSERVDHQVGGTKDLADAMAGVAYSITKYGRTMVRSQTSVVLSKMEVQTELEAKYEDLMKTKDAVSKGNFERFFPDDDDWV